MIRGSVSIKQCLKVRFYCFNLSYLRFTFQISDSIYFPITLWCPNHIHLLPIMILESTLDITHESTIKHEITNSKFNLSYMHFDTTLYDEFLTNKTNQVKSLFQDYPHLGSIDDLLVVKSPVSNYRNRCRFSIADSNDHSSDSEQININSYQNIYYTMYEEGAASVKVMKFPIAVNSIVNLMEPILDCIKNNEELALGLRSLNFLSSLDGQVIISFCYERPIDLIWKNAASEIRTFLLQSNLPYVKDLNFIGRSKKIKMVIGSDTVLESIQLQDGRLLKYYQVDDGFSNPNAIVNISVLNWVCESVKYCNQHFCNQGGREGTNILELFCGNGNHTVAIAGINFIHLCLSLYVFSHLSICL